MQEVEYRKKKKKNRDVFPRWLNLPWPPLPIVMQILPVKSVTLIWNTEPR